MHWGPSPRLWGRAGRPGQGLAGVGAHGQSHGQSRAGSSEQTCVPPSARQPPPLWGAASQQPLGLDGVGTRSRSPVRPGGLCPSPQWAPCHPASGPASALQLRACRVFQSPPGTPPGSWVWPSTWLPRVSPPPICYHAWSLACIRGVTCPSSVPGASHPPLWPLEQKRRLSLRCFGGAGRMLAWPGQPGMKFKSGSVSTAVDVPRVAAGRGRGLGPPENGAAKTGCISLGFNMSPKSPDGPVWTSVGQREPARGR